jgi:hypothetical protein
MYLRGERLKSIIKYNNNVANRTKPSKQLVNFDTFKIVEVSMDRNCLFNSFIVGLKTTSSGRLFLDVVKTFNMGKPENILRISCFYMFYNLLFVPNNTGKYYPDKEGFINFVKDSISWKEQMLEIPDTFVQSKFGCTLMDFYIQNYPSSMENPFKNNNLNVTQQMKDKIKLYLEKMIQNKTSVDVKIVGFIISYLFNVKVEISVVDNEQIAHDKTIVLESRKSTDTIHAIYTSITNHYDALVIKEFTNPNKSSKFFINIKQSHTDMLNQQKAKSGMTLKTEIVPSFFPQENIIFLSESIKTSNNNNQNVILPEFVPLYCSQVSTRKNLSEGTVGDFVKMDFSFDSNKKQSTIVQIYMITSNNFTKTLFNYQGKPGNYLSMFRLNEHVNSDWYKSYSIRIYSYYTSQYPEITLTCYKSKDSEEPIMFSYYISQECKIPNYIFMEISNDNKCEESEDKTKMFNSIIKVLQKHYS